MFVPIPSWWLHILFLTKGSFAILEVFFILKRIIWESLWAEWWMQLWTYVVEVEKKNGWKIVVLGGVRFLQSGSVCDAERSFSL